ncbi:MAG: molybdopterin-dependent oxidoreductase, partial [SAR324 cluster bacterium]|nr:molybdopterin-dependent oxidoreductase [SAR324 cluster bacterium]
MSQQNHDNLQSHFRTCPLCEAICGIEIQTRGSEIVSIRGDAEDSLSRGHICPKAVALQDLQNDPDRLRQPLKRTESGWKEISWEEAFDEVATRLKDIQNSFGKSAVGVYLGNPNVHNLGAMIFGPMFAKSLRTRNNFSATSVDQLPHQLVSLLMYGHQLLIPIPDVERTRFLVILGGNPLASNGSLMSVPDIGKRLREIQDQGGEVVVLDPRRTETARVASRYIPIQPGSDVLLLAAMIHTLFQENLVHSGRLEIMMEGVEAIQAIVEPFAPEKVSEFTGISADTIRQLVRDFRKAESAVLYGRMGVSTQKFGALTQWLIQVFNILTGNLDREGGAMFTKPAVDIVDITARMGQKGHYAIRRSRVRKLPEFGGEFPVATLADEILTPGEGQIRALVTLAGNPVLSTPNGKRLDTALEQLDFMVSIDFYLNETTRHANIILPPTSPLEPVIDQDAQALLERWQKLVMLGEAPQGAFDARLEQLGLTHET